MDWAILIAASIAASSSLVGAWLAYRSDRRIQKAEHEHEDDARLYAPRMDLYSGLIKILRGHERDFKQDRPTDYDDPQAARLWVTDVFLELARDSTERVTEATTKLGQLRLVASSEVIAAAEESFSRLQSVQSAWMALAFEFTKESSQQSLSEVLKTSLFPAQDALTTSIDQLEVTVRNELRIG